jgi:hypothetical protein
MPGIFYELDQAAGVLGVATAEVEDMVELRELTLVTVGTRRLVHVRDVEKVKSRVEHGGPLRVRREFRGGMVPEAVRRAAKELGVPEDDLVYDVLEHGALRMPGVDGRPARIAVQLPEDMSGFPEKDAMPTSPVAPVAPAVMADPTADTHTAQADRIAEDASRAGEMLRAEKAQPTGPAENIESFYAPEQVARLLGREITEVNLLIYRRELPAVNINDYLWVPEEAAREMKEKLAPLVTGKPPRPFRLVVPDEDTATGDPLSRLGAGEAAEGEVRDDLRRRVMELEALVESLREEALRAAPAIPDTDDARENSHGEPDAVPSA